MLKTAAELVALALLVSAIAVWAEVIGHGL